MFNNNRGGHSTRGRGRGRGRGGRSGWNNTRGRGRGGSTYRGGHTRGRGGHRGGRLRIAKIVTFQGALDAHKSGQQVGTTALALWQEQKQIFTGGNDGVLNIFDYAGQLVSSQQGNGPVGSLCFSNGWLFAGYLLHNAGNIGQVAGCVKAYNMTESPPKEYDFALNPNFPAAHEKQVNSICVVNDMVVTASADGTIKAWKLNVPNNQWSCVGILGGQISHNAEVLKILFFKDRLFSCASNGEVKIWDILSTGNCLSSFQAHQDAITDMIGWEAMLPSMGQKSVLLTCSKDCKIKVWDLGANGIIPPTATPVFDYPPPNSPMKPKSVSSLSTAFHQNKHLLVAGYQDGSIQLMDLPDFTDLGFLSGHSRRTDITCVAVVEKMLLAGADDGNLNCFAFD